MKHNTNSYVLLDVVEYVYLLTKFTKILDICKSLCLMSEDLLK